MNIHPIDSDGNRVGPSVTVPGFVSVNQEHVQTVDPEMEFYLVKRRLPSPRQRVIYENRCHEFSGVDPDFDEFRSKWLDYADHGLIRLNIFDDEEDRDAVMDVLENMLARMWSKIRSD